MSEWVLILSLTRALLSVDFATEESCKEAAKQVEEQLEEQMWVKAICVRRPPPGGVQ
jgi:hypothetical protein